MGTVHCNPRTKIDPDFMWVRLAQLPLTHNHSDPLISSRVDLDEQPVNLGWLKS